MDKIYLQGNGEDETTWCIDRIHDDDVEYVRVKMDKENIEVTRMNGEKTLVKIDVADGSVKDLLNHFSRKNEFIILLEKQIDYLNSLIMVKDVVIEKLKKKNEWISVEDSTDLPKVTGCYNTYIPSLLVGQQVQSFFFDADFGFWSIPSPSFGTQDVTHWKPLPLPPITEKE